MKKLITMLVTLCIAFTSLFAVGCGNDANTLYIEVLDKGFGMQWIYDLADKFEAANEGYTVSVTPGYESTNYETAIKSGKGKTDIYFSTDHMMKYQYNSQVLGGKRYDSMFVSLKDLYETKIPGEDRTLGEKVDSQFTDFFTIERTNGDEEIYLFPYAIASTGIIINKDVWQDEWKKPNTTAELFALADTIKGAGKVPFIHSVDESYYNIMFEVFTAQYEGLATMDNFWNVIDKYGESMTPEVMLYDGILESYKVMEKLLKAENQYQHPSSLEAKFTGAQTSFFNKDNKIAMMLNGDWVLTELSKNVDVSTLSDVTVMKMPVISALGTKLGITEAELSAIVDYVDGTVTTAPEFASTKNLTDDQVIAAVREARGINGSMGFWHGAFIPIYSDQVELAKKFFLFMASDEGCNTYTKATGNILPYDYDWKNNPDVRPFVKEMMEELYEGKSLYPIERKKHRMFCVGGLNIANNINAGDGWIKCFSAIEASDFRNADEVYMANYEAVKDRWSLIMDNAGYGQ